MLVLSRKKNESVQIDSQIEIKVLSINRKQVKLGISAPDCMRILRTELVSYPAEAVACQDFQWQQQLQ